MTYRVYIKKDYKNKIERVGGNQNHSRLFKIVCLAVLFVSAYFIFDRDTPEPVETTPIISTFTPITVEPPVSGIPETESFSAKPPDVQKLLESNTAKTDVVEDMSANALSQDNIPLLPPIEKITSNTEEITNLWQSVTVKPGDSLALIFARLGLSPTSLYKLMSLGKDVSNLKKIRPGQKINFLIDDKELLGLEYEMNLTNTLKVSKDENEFKSEIIQIELEKVVKNSSVIISDSLFLSGKRSGLSDNLIMQLVSIYGWDIDFALDIREGDSFTVIYEEQYKDGVKVSDGPIIAAEFINRNTPLRAIRYTHEDGHAEYYADNGDAMRKAFLRTPVELARISSRFNLKRKHPILNKIRAHKGVDYAAATGTPVKATGDGTVILAGKKGGYGRTIILKHGGTYSTLYAHLHRYARGVRTGSRVKQGQIIGYVGKSGLATGPHLHYEFRINGVHRNPLTVKLPKVESIPKEALPEFKLKINPLIAELDRLTGKSAIAAQEQGMPIKLADAMMEDG